ncbi:hypothetical protein F511_28450 [Dorcoceras hygrometricum]|uniref:Uncharacterized protein n=1 Tax=Dorcoceras hygrometricum TaxID=472368 RepID=A0A2Z7D847_9LAMI|nr:hypothetical protein F511_28450 [Dorcoceras hygrometricum]
MVTSCFLLFCVGVVFADYCSPLILSGDSRRFRPLFDACEVALDSSREDLPFYTILGGCCWLERDREVVVFGRWNSDFSGPLIVVIVRGIKAQRIEERAKCSSRGDISAAKQLTIYEELRKAGCQLLSSIQNGESDSSLQKKRTQVLFLCRYYTEERCTIIERRQDGLLKR